MQSFTALAGGNQRIRIWEKTLEFFSTVLSTLSPYHEPYETVLLFSAYVCMLCDATIRHCAVGTRCIFFVTMVCLSFLSAGFPFSFV